MNVSRTITSRIKVGAHVENNLGKYWNNFINLVGALEFHHVSKRSLLKRKSQELAFEAKEKGTYDHH